jgi:hypothetical protein
MPGNAAASLAAAALLLSATGCATTADARNAKGTGLARVHAAPFEEVWRELPPTLMALSLGVSEVDKAGGCVLATSGWSAFSYGEVVAVFAEPAAEAGRTRVEVVSKRVVATTVLAHSWENDIHDKLAERLKATATTPPAPAPPPAAGTPRS